MESFKEYVEREIIPRYADFDGAHKEDHVRSVVRRSLELAKFYPVKPEVVYLAAAYHDLGLSEGRELHHLASGRKIREDIMLHKWFSEDEIELAAQAAEDHRASGKNPPRSIYGCIVAEADRQIDPETVVSRTVLYGFDHYPQMNRRQMWERTLSHLKEKYAEGGYLKLWIPESDNAARLAELRSLIADEARLRQMFDVIYREKKYLPYVCERFKTDAHYREGHIRIVTPGPGTVVLGMHKPEMMAEAKAITAREDVREWLDDWKCTASTLSHEERSIWGLVIDSLKCDIDERLVMVDDYLPAVNSWAVCDTFCCNARWARRPSASDKVWLYICRLLKSGEEFTRRAGIVLMMCCFLTPDTIARSFEALKGMHLRDGEPYYVRMAVAWLLATALAKDEMHTREFVSSAECGIPSDILRLYVRKARESFRTNKVDPFLPGKGLNEIGKHGCPYHCKNTADHNG